MVCALLKDSVVWLLPHPGTSSEVPVWHGRKCMLHPDDRAASLQWWPAGHSRVHESLSSVSCADSALSALGGNRWRSEMGRNDFVALECNCSVCGMCGYPFILSCFVFRSLPGNVRMCISHSKCGVYGHHSLVCKTTVCCCSSASSVLCLVCAQLLCAGTGHR